MDFNPGETPTLTQTIQAAIKSAMLDLHTMMPGTITAWDPSTGLADVQPALKWKPVDADAQNIPILTEVPVIVLGTNAGRLGLKLAPGDSVMLLFSERSIELWMERGGQIDPEDSRRHDLSDAVALAGLYPAGMGPRSNQAPELLLLLTETIDAINALVGVVTGSTCNITPSPALIAIKAKLEAMREA